MSPFEFDIAKSESNCSKHGLDFVEAQSLWNDPMPLEIPAKTDDEPRYLLKRWHFMKAKKFDQQFDNGADIMASLDLSKARRVQQAQKRVNVDFPTWMIDSLDREACKLGVTRQSVIKVWLAERLQATTSDVPIQPTPKVATQR